MGTLFTIRLVFAAVLVISCHCKFGCEFEDQYEASARTSDGQYLTFYVDFKAQKAKFTDAKEYHFWFFDFNDGVRKSYKLKKDGTCEVKNLEPQLTLPAVNPATDTWKYDLGGYQIFEKDGLQLWVFSNCNPKKGTLVEYEPGKSPARIYTVRKTKVNDNELKPDLKKCT